MPTPTVPPDLDAVRRLLRPDMAAIPSILAAWPRGEGPLADVPLLDPGDVAPRAFTELAGTVRVAATSSTLVTVAALLDLPDGGGVLVAAMALNPHDLASPPDAARSRAALAAAGARRDDVPVEVAALVGPLEGGGPVAGVGVVRPLVLADPANFPHPDDATAFGTDLRDAARAAVAEDREVLADLAGSPLHPLPGDLARIWSPLFEVTRAATAGLAARGAASGG
ncbi:hypothetical protein [Euzebya sp.]|uniref:hypothetical protein n=1 Tax=Euzebya sp. TaxID=1971409 RepID=UPI003512A9F1